MKKFLKVLSIVLCIAMALCVAPKATVADEPLKVTEVGVLDSDPKYHFVDFGASLLWQASFNEVIFEGDEMPGDPGKRAIYKQGLYGDYIVINGKTVTQWNQLEYNSVEIHVGENEALGVYLEFNTKKIEGLISADTENYVTFLKGFPSASGKTLQENITFYLAPGATTPFEIVDSSRAEIPVIEDESKKPLTITEIGVLDQNPKKGFHDFGSSFLWQIDFNKDFWDKSQLNSSGRLDHIHSQIGDYIIINGWTVNQWNEEVFNSVMIHVVTNGIFGQYLEVNTNAILDGLVSEYEDNYVTILKGFPNGGENSLQESVCYKLPAGSKDLWIKLDEVIEHPNAPVPEESEEPEESEDIGILEDETETEEEDTTTENDTVVDDDTQIGEIEDETENSEVDTDTEESEVGNNTEDQNQNGSANEEQKNPTVWIIVGVVAVVVIAAAVVWFVVKGKKKQE